MLERRCCRCKQCIEPLEDFFSQDGENSDEVYCADCIDIEMENELFTMSTREKAELLGYGCYYDTCPEDEDPNEPIKGQIDMFGGVVE